MVAEARRRTAISWGDKAVEVPRNTPLMRPASRTYNGRWCHHSARLSSLYPYRCNLQSNFIGAGFNLLQDPRLGTLTKTEGNYSMPLRNGLDTFFILTSFTLRLAGIGVVMKPGFSRV
ncbi:hypothetical protein C2W62_38695 [Candidatus Entotheonella serta]|nr:hypothetical protein C2W62_38695 [Candidatus Entotheonella serta]